MKLLRTVQLCQPVGARRARGRGSSERASLPTSCAFSDTKRENADEKIRIKTLSLGVVIPTSPSNWPRRTRICICSRPMTSRRSMAALLGNPVTEKYAEMVGDKRIKKKDQRALSSRPSAEIQFRIGLSLYHVEDTVNRQP